MPDIIEIKYYLADLRHPVTPNTDVWNQRLPQGRTGVDTTDEGLYLTYGTYFTVVRNYLEENHYQVILQGAAQMLGHAVGPSTFSELSVILEKHGQYYHPARITTRVGERTLSFAINLAVTECGRAFLHTDFHNIRRLQALFSYNFLPVMYHCADIEPGNSGPAVTLAFGEWLSGFHEFHQTLQKETDRQVVAVWDPAHGHKFLTEHQSQALFQHATRILTAYLNLETFEQVLNWHHAAGDFVVRTAGDRIDIRLITVRRYGPLFPGLEITADNVLHLLTVFLLNNSMRMRLDRYDGVGEPAWAGPGTAASVIFGTLDGLQLQIDSGSIPEDVLIYFRQYLKMLGLEDLKELCRDILARWHADTIGRSLALSQVKVHAMQMEKAIRQLDI